MDGGRIVSYGCWCDPVRSLRELIPTEVGAEETGNIEKQWFQGASIEKGGNHLGNTPKSVGWEVNQEETQ